MGEQLAYAPNEEKPYTGGVKSMYPSGQVKLLTSFKNGELDGRVTVWNENGYETRKANYKNGMKVK